MTHDRGYFRWLIRNYVGDLSTYKFLLEQMFRKAYYYTVDRDENRAEDGLYLRDLYLEDHPNVDASAVPEGPCSFLEFLIGLSVRLSVLLADGEPVPPHEYFWELVSRLRLTDYTDDTYRYDDTVFMVDLTMTDYMDRKYDKCGIGGLFPLAPPCKNQRRVEVWYQMHSYLLQNPGFFE
jgi:hypothetical protein